jgi:hypothetical protein
LDDTASYQGYQTRFFRDSKNNAVQIYIQPQTSRIVLVWADALNGSAGFSARDARGRTARVSWGAESAEVSDSEGARGIEYSLVTQTSSIQLGWFVLGSMRVERDFVYAGRHLKPFAARPYQVPEESLLVAAVRRLPVEERTRHLALLKAGDMEVLRARLEPTITSSTSDSVATVRVVQHSLDGKNSSALELLVDPRKVRMKVTGRTVAVETRPGSPIHLRVRATTDAPWLTPLSRQQIFNRPFLQFMERAGADTGGDTAARFRRLERQVRGVELLSSEQKLMAGLPNFATYFGRDMMMTALMMRPIWSPEMSERVIASVLRKLGPRGEVSHEEALGGQAVREHAVIYDSLITGYLLARQNNRRGVADSLLSRSGELLRDLQRTRENYHMIDDEFQLPVLVARYLSDPSVSAEKKRAFLLESEPGGTRLSLLMKELELVASLARPYVLAPKATNLVGFSRLDASKWRSSSWRDSGAGYAGGRFAMDINAIWVPRALEALETILNSFSSLGLTSPLDDSTAAGGVPVLAEYSRDRASLRRAIDIWKGARRHFEITLAPEVIRERMRAKLSWLPAPERRFWQKKPAEGSGGKDSLTFLVLSLHADGRPIPVVNTDPATELFLADSADEGSVLKDIAPILRPYPIGLFVHGLGPVVANDAYASPAIWESFREDTYHGPRVVWGREVNLILLGLANHVLVGRDKSGQLKDALRSVLESVNASGLQHNELWSYEVKDRRLLPVRYGTSSDVQLWNTTNLVVQYMMSKLTGVVP